MNPIRIAIVGIGNCASSLVQGLEYYRDKQPEEAIGLMHWEIGGFRPCDIEVACAFDIDTRKVGKDISEAIFKPPNCTEIFCRNVPKAGVLVRMGCILTGSRITCRTTPSRAPSCPPTSARRPMRRWCSPCDNPGPRCS